MRSGLIGLCAICVVTCACADEATTSQRSLSKVIVHQLAPPLSSEAVAEDWSEFLGSRGDMTSREMPLRLDFGSNGPLLIWEMATGSGYAAPSVVGGRLVFFHRAGDEARVECVDAETGQNHWTFAYPTGYTDRFNFSNGPRSSPVISDGKVYVHGAEGRLHCLDLASGKLLWKLDTSEQYKVPQDFFGVGSSPIVYGKLLILAIGAPEGPCVVALDKETGKEVWRAGKTWRAGYATPMVATLNGKPRVLFFAGGDDDPPTGGLIGIDPANGRVAFEFPFRSRIVNSVNASNPVVSGNQIFISSSYNTGAVLLEVGDNDRIKEVWRTRKFGAHFMTPIVREQFLYGITGAGMGDTEIACVDWASGDVKWHTAPNWPTTVVQAGEKREVMMSSFRGSLLGLTDGFLILGERGHLAFGKMTPDGYTELSRTSLFYADETWTPPVISRGLLYICQNKPDRITGSTPRLLCYSLR